MTPIYKLLTTYICATALFCSQANAQTTTPLSIYKNGKSLITGTWGAKLSEISTDNPYEGTQHFRFNNYDLNWNWWDGFGLNLDSWGGTKPVDFSSHTHLRIAYRGISAGNVLQLRLVNPNAKGGNNIDVGEPSTDYKVVDVPLARLGAGLNLATISEIQISVGGAATGMGTLYVDAIELVTKTTTPPTTKTVASTRAARMGNGTNTAGWLESFWLLPSNTYPIIDRYTEADFKNFAAFGFKTVRLPVIFQSLADPNPPYKLNTSHEAYRLVDSAIAWSNRYNLNLIIDNHHGFPEISDANFMTEKAHLVAIWQQLIQRYGYLNPEKFFFELYNEPFRISNGNLRTVLQATIDAIRNTGDKHTLIVGGSSWNSAGSLSLMGTFSDTNLIYTFHSYDPVPFCNQGFDWDGNGLPDFGPVGLVFPENATVIPTMKSNFAAVKTWSMENNVPIFLGEFGVSSYADATSRCNWIQTMGEILDENQLPACYWDTKFSEQSFALFKNDNVKNGELIPCFGTALRLSYNAVLPVEWLSLKATPLLKTVQIEWQTASEKNTSHTDIERSFDGKTFQKIGQVKAIGNSVTPQNYTYLDQNPLNNVNYYRIQQTDLDGRTQVSNVVSVRMGNGKGKIVIAPNPAKDNVILNFDGELEQATLQVYDLLGRVVLTKNTVNSTHILDVSTYQTGTYIVEIKAQGQTFREKFVKY
jgi:Cellulase (glycosyl hydrolase family 5)/Secretion system C-terminal sorting domain